MGSESMESNPGPPFLTEFPELSYNPLSTAVSFLEKEW